VVKKIRFEISISQELRGIKSDATCNHSIHVHLCQMTSNSKLSRDKKFLGVVGESPWGRKIRAQPLKDHTPRNIDSHM